MVSSGYRSSATFTCSLVGVSWSSDPLNSLSARCASSPLLGPSKNAPRTTHAAPPDGRDWFRPNGGEPLWSRALPRPAHSSLAVIGVRSPPYRGRGAVDTLLSGALSWLAVVTIGLAPILVYWLARVIGQALQRKARGPPAGSPRAELEEERGQRHDA